MQKYAKFPNQDPAAILDYEVNWTPWLQPGETIVDSDWSITPEGEHLSSPSVNGGKVGVWVQNLSPGQTYRLTNHIVTSSGREDDRTGEIYCTER